MSKKAKGEKQKEKEGKKDFFMQRGILVSGETGKPLHPTSNLYYTDCILTKFKNKQLEGEYYPLMAILQASQAKMLANKLTLGR